MKITRLKKCTACGTTYEYCNSCAEFKTQPSWKNIFCDEDCKKIFMAVTDYKAGEITAEEAYDILEIVPAGKFTNNHIVTAYEELGLN